MTPPRTPARRFLAACLAASALLGAGTAAGMLTAVAPSHQAGALWLVSGEERVEGGSASFAGKVVVQAGGTLVIDGVNLVLAADVPCGYADGRVCVPDLLVEPGGRLVVRDSVVSGIHDEAIRHAFLMVLGEADVRDSLFVRTTGFIVQGDAARGTFERNVFALSSGGVNALRGAEVVVRGNTFEGVGVHIADGPNVVEANTVRDSFVGIRVSTTVVGARCCRGVPVVADNLVIGGEVGIYSDSIEPFAIRGNRIEGAATGITVTVLRHPESPAEGAPDVTGNAFMDVGTGVRVRNAASSLPADVAPRDAVTVTLRGNDLTGACRDVVVEDEPDMRLHVDARWNWWGSSAGPEDAPDCPALTGSVDWDPWLAAAP